MPIVVGIDGTGSDVNPGTARDARYDVAFADSFVRRIAGSGGANKRYFRGPVMLGGGLVEAVNQGYQFVLERRRSAPNETVLLTGYSRGAAGAVVIAKKLKRQNIPVAGLLLFDCVDRHLFIDADVIPNNVGEVMHVIRDPRSSSRESFSNDGMRYSPPTKFANAYMFLCTHGGMGGTPWTLPPGVDPSTLIDEGGVDGMTTISYENDAQVSQQVWSYVQPFIRKYGFM